MSITGLVVESQQFAANDNVQALAWILALIILAVKSWILNNPKFKHTNHWSDLITWVSRVKLQVAEPAKRQQAEQPKTEPEVTRPLGVL